jgi:transcriptional accessory protein Tex/SPT6
VYENAAGFLRIRPMTGDDGEVDLSVEGLDILDNTRIHPECYHTYDMYANNPICIWRF